MRIAAVGLRKGICEMCARTGRQSLTGRQGRSPVRGENRGHDLHLVQAAVGNNGRMGRSMSARSGFPWCRSAFTLDEAAGNCPRRDLFTVIAGKGEEIATLDGTALDGRHQRYGVSVADDDRAVSLLGKLVGFERQSTVAKFAFNTTCLHRTTLSFGAGAAVRTCTGRSNRGKSAWKTSAGRARSQDARTNGAGTLLSQAQPPDDRDVSGPVGVAKVPQQAGPLADHLEQAALLA